MLYTQFTEHPIPRIVRAALGVGNLVVEIDSEDRRSFRLLSGV
jgi:hypothetical protein